MEALEAASALRFLVGLMLAVMASDAKGSCAPCRRVRPTGSSARWRCVGSMTEFPKYALRRESISPTLQIARILSTWWTGYGIRFRIAVLGVEWKTQID